MMIKTLQKKVDRQALRFCLQCARWSEGWSKRTWLTLLIAFCLVGLISGSVVLMTAFKASSASLEIPVPVQRSRLPAGTDIPKIWLDALRRRLLRDTILLDSLHKHDTLRYQHLMTLHPLLLDSLRFYESKVDHLLK